ncbi:MAG TPA: FliH/SctL family protein [Candidatus Cloacimonadota bacterium]|nr:FliH/SctL family protein [Candidatus Cloacimonadota bacterium]HOQ80159.1 FliH/SctL family protein [Candidatus Cloacimonadota bacterium]HPK41280.1 FliH/SctL family protein [Candidatus Cloacimonadota bacterium]
MSFNKNGQEYFFNINPGMQAKNARFVDGHPDPSTSIFDLHQLALINNMIENNVNKTIEKMNLKMEQENKDNYQKGLKEGTKQAQQQLQAQVNQTLIILNQLIANLSSQVDRLREDQEQEILSFIITIARKVIDIELETNPNIVLSVLKNALNLLNEREEIKILVNAKDWLTVKNNIDKLNLQFDLPKQVEIVNAPDISPGGCRIEFNSGSVDADIDTQFDEIRRKLLKNV